MSVHETAHPAHSQPRSEFYRVSLLLPFEARSRLTFFRECSKEGRRPARCLQLAATSLLRCGRVVNLPGEKAKAFHPWAKTLTKLPMAYGRVRPWACSRDRVTVRSVERRKDPKCEHSSSHCFVLRREEVGGAKKRRNLPGGRCPGR